jgi:hypothetical protein
MAGELTAEQVRALLGLEARRRLPMGSALYFLVTPNAPARSRSRSTPSEVQRGSGEPIFPACSTIHAR